MTPPLPFPGPYPGLRPFERHEDALFFGREEQVDQLLDKLDETHFLAVLGTSGSGKSSLVRAGLLPALDSGFLAGAGARWDIAELRPGDQPLRRLATVLIEDTDWGKSRSEAAAGAPPADKAIVELERDLRRGSLALNWRLGVNPLPEGTRLLILVDQFEELFRYQRSNEREAADFVALLLGAASHPAVYLVITMRSEYLGDCSLYPDLPEAINTGLFLTPALTPEQMADAIQLPPELPQFGGEVEPALVRKLLDEARGQTDQLPLLQHTLMRLWDLDDGDKHLTLAELEGLGGLRQALNDHLEQAYAELDAEQKRIAEVLFRGLTERGSGERDTRRPMRLGEIADLARVDPIEVAKVVEVFRQPGRSFLMPPAGEDLKPDKMLDITHEALIRQWRRLRDWTANEAEQAELYQRLESAAQRHKEKTGALWIDPDLQIALNWREEHKPNELWAARYGGDYDLAMGFLDASRDAREAERQAEEQRRRQEIRRARKIAFASLVALVLTAALAGWGWYERTHAIEAEQSAEHHAEVAEAQKNLAEKNAEQARISAGIAERGRVRAEQAERARTSSLFDSGLTHAALLAEGEDYAEAREVLRSTVELDTDIPEDRRHTRNLLAGYVDILGGSADKIYESAGAGLSGGVALSPDGRWLAAAGERGTLVLFDAESGELVRRLEGHDPDIGDVGAVVSTVFDPESRLLYSGGEDGRIIRWAVPDGEKLGEWEAPDRVYALAISPDGKLLASGGMDKAITLWSTETGERLRTLDGHTDSIATPKGLAFSRDGKRLASASYDKTARIWDVETGETLQTLRWHNDKVNAVAFSPDGKLVATGSYDKRIVLWDAETGRPRRVLTGHDNVVFGVAFDAKGRRLLSASRDNTMRLWDVATGVTLRVYQGHTAGLWTVARHGDTLYTASDDQTVRRWFLDRPGQWVWELPGEPVSAAAAPDGSFITVGFADGSLRAYALPGSAADSPHPNPSPLRGEGLSRQSPGQSGADGALPEHQPIAEVEVAHGSDGIRRMAFDGEGTRLATAGADHTAKLWRIDRHETGLDLTLFHTLEGHTGPVHAVAFSPDGRTLATAGYDGRVGLFDVETGEGELFEAHDGRIADVDFGQDEKRLLSVGIGDFKLRLWDLTKQPPEPREVAEAQDMLLWASLRPDGHQLAAVGRDQVVTLRDLGPEPAGPRRLVGHEQTVLRAIYGPDGRQLATVSSDMTVRLWDLETGKELLALRLSTEFRQPSPLWDFDFRCTEAGDCWIAAPLTMGRLALYRLPYLHPPESIAP